MLKLSKMRKSNPGGLIERRNMEHPNKEVQSAIVRLNDALCMCERATSRESVLIIREQGGFEHRSVSGKPNVPSDIPDADLFNITHNE